MIHLNPGEGTDGTLGWGVVSPGRQPGKADCRIRVPRDFQGLSRKISLLLVVWPESAEESVKPRETEANPSVRDCEVQEVELCGREKGNLGICIHLTGRALVPPKKGSFFFLASTLGRTRVIRRMGCQPLHGNTT